MGSNHAAELLKDMISQLYAVTRGHERGLEGRLFCFTTYEGGVDITVVRCFEKGRVFVIDGWGFYDT